MRNLVHLTATAAVLIGVALPGAAQTDAMDMSSASCADFMAMTPEEQTSAMEAMQMASDEMATDEMATDEMANDEMATDEMATDEMASDEMASDEMMSEEMTAMMSACDGNPDMMAMEAMKSSMDN